MSLNDLRPKLPAAAQRAFDASDLAPTALRLKFGPRMRFDVGDNDDPYAPPPKTELGRRLAEHAERCLNTWLQIREAHFRSLADKSVDSTAAFLRSARSAKAKLQDVDSGSRALFDDLDYRTKHLATQRANLLKPPATVGEAQVDAEVRAMIRAEPDPTKAAALAKAHPRAVATAPAVALGMDPDSPLYQGAIRDYLAEAAPELVAEMDELHDAIDQFTRADQAVVELSRSIIDFDLADRLHSGADWDAAA